MRIRGWAGLVLCIALIAVIAAGGWRHYHPSPAASVFADFKPTSKGKVWTVTGTAGSEREAFADTSGAFQPRLGTYSIHYFIYDRDFHRLYSPLIGDPEDTSRSLLEGYLPAPVVDWNAGSLGVSSTTFVTACGTADGVCISSFKIQDNSEHRRRLLVFAAAVSNQLMGLLCGSYDMKYDSRRCAMVVDGKVLFSCDTKPDASALVAVNKSRQGALTDITGYIRNGRLPGSDEWVFARDGVTSGAVRFDLDLGPGETRTLTLRAPVAEMSADEWAASKLASVQVTDAKREFTRYWDDQLNRVEISLPDQRYSDCFRASLAYLMILSDHGVPYPGPAKYGLFWVRDFAYISDAFYFAGRSDLIPPGLRQLRKMQTASGGFKARLSSVDDEYDAPGEAIYTFVQRYRRTGDKKRLTDAWPSIISACRYIRAKRLSDPRTKGILPVSVSAEDLGGGRGIFYWDDFWCIRGLRDAAYAAGELGKAADAQWITREANALENATWASIRDTAKRYSISYIPTGPNESRTSGMARGTSCGLWPCAVLDPSNLFVRKSFDTYWDKWIAPSAGGFVHKDHFWAYAGMDLANGYLMLNEPDRASTMLEWTIEHDPTGGFYSWPEGMYRNNLTLADGDMPHAWMCASYIALMRNVLARESGDDLVLLSGVPRNWLAAGKEISVRDLPTEFGKLIYRLRCSADALKLSIGIGVKPRGVYRITLPKGLDATGVSVDGLTPTLPTRERTWMSGERASGTWISRTIKIKDVKSPALDAPGYEVVLPASARDVVIRVKRS